MQEQKHEVINFRVVCICDKCGIGFMEWDGAVLLSDTAAYKHKCKYCGATKIFQGKHYPFIEFGSIKYKIEEYQIINGVDLSKRFNDVSVRECFNENKKGGTEMEKVLLKDIVIPKGTIFRQAPLKTVREGNDHFDCVVGLSDNTSGVFEYCIDADFDELDEYFTDVK